MIYDAAGSIQYCEIRGECTRQTWKVLVDAISGATAMEGLEVMLLPEQRLQNLQIFEETLWPGDQAPA
jgi:hypothetical protein